MRWKAYRAECEAGVKITKPEAIPRIVASVNETIRELKEQIEILRHLRKHLEKTVTNPKGVRTDEWERENMFRLMPAEVPVRSDPCHAWRIEGLGRCRADAGILPGKTCGRRLGRGRRRGQAANDEALVDGERLLSAYRTLQGVKIWIITEAADDEGNRSSTRTFAPPEY